MQFSGIYAITDDLLLPGERLFIAAEAALAEGIGLLQYRSKSEESEYKLACAARLLEICRSYNTPLIINDDVELCQAVSADGVHLGKKDGDLHATRHSLGAQAIIGITCHASVEEAVAAEAATASYVAFGRFFASTTKPQAPAAPLSVLEIAHAKLSIPIVAIGGINAENGAAVLQAGADVLAVIHSLFGNEDVAASARQLNKLFQSDTTAS